MSYKKKIKKHNKITIWNNGLMDRDEVMHLLLSDNEISLLLLGEIYKGYRLPNMSVLYWDDVELVASEYGEQTITSMKSDQKQTIGDMKKDIIEFCAKQKREIEKHNNELDETINDLKDIYENILSDVFYDMRWDDEQDEDEDKQNDMLNSLQHAIDIIKKERK